VRLSWSWIFSLSFFVGRRQVRRFDALQPPIGGRLNAAVHRPHGRARLGDLPGPLWHGHEER